MLFRFSIQLFVKKLWQYKGVNLIRFILPSGDGSATNEIAPVWFFYVIMIKLKMVLIIKNENDHNDVYNDDAYDDDDDDDYEDDDED